MHNDRYKMAQDLADGWLIKYEDCKQQLIKAHIVIDRLESEPKGGFNKEIESLRGQLEEKNETILDHVEIQNSLRHQLHDAIKREVMLRDVMREVLDAVWLKTSHELARKFSEALAATDDLDGLIVCKKKPTAWCQDVIYEMAPEFAFSWVKTQLHDFPLFSAWEPK